MEVQAVVSDSLARTVTTLLSAFCCPVVKNQYMDFSAHKPINHMLVFCSNCPKADTMILPKYMKYILSGIDPAAKSHVVTSKTGARHDNTNNAPV